MRATTRNFHENLVTQRDRVLRKNLLRSASIFGSHIHKRGHFLRTAPARMVRIKSRNFPGGKAAQTPPPSKAGARTFLLSLHDGSAVISRPPASNVFCEIE